jgi:hypothetical protein
MKGAYTHTDRFLQQMLSFLESLGSHKRYGSPTPGQDM